MFVTFFTFYIKSTHFYYYLNQKNSLQYKFFFLFSYKLFQLYIISITFSYHFKNKNLPTI